MKKNIRDKSMKRGNRTKPRVSYAYSWPVLSKKRKFSPLKKCFD